MADLERIELERLRRRRRRQLANHMIAYFGVMVLLVPINAYLAPGDPWFIIPMVAWGAPLALHVAYVMELFGPPGSRGGRRGRR